MASLQDASTTLEPSLSGITVCRLMRPDDANNSGNVHGGTILKMIEEAGAIITTRYCNTVENRDSADYEALATALARIEKMDFVEPMYLGEVAEVHTEIMYTSAHSIEVMAVVWAENILKGTKRTTNTARLWYVAVSVNDPDKVMLVPPMTQTDLEVVAQAKTDYENRKSEQALDEKRLRRMISFSHCDLQPDPLTVAFAQTTLIHLVGPADLWVSGHCRGGVILKLMDECAGITAAKHCKTNVVTASIDATNFHKKVEKGGLVTMRGIPTFTSDRSIEVEVIVEVETPWKPGTHRARAVDAFFTFVSLTPDKKPQKIPPLKLETEEEKERFEGGRSRYERRKELRKASQKKK